MSEFYYTPDIPQTPEGFQQVRWEDGERPDWWEQQRQTLRTSHLWVLTDKLQQQRIVFNLINIEGRVNLQELFLTAPLFAGTQHAVGIYTIELVDATALLRTLWQRLIQFKELIKQTEMFFQPLVLSYANELAETGQLAVFFNKHSEEHIGPSEFEMSGLVAASDDHWYELEAQLRGMTETITAQRKAQQAADGEKRQANKAKREASQATKAISKKVDRYIEYMGMPNYRPIDPVEVEAYPIYQRYQQAPVKDKYELMLELRNCLKEGLS